VFYKIQSTTLSSQTLDVVWVERIQIYQVLAPGLIWLSSMSTQKLKNIHAYSFVALYCMNLYFGVLPKCYFLFSLSFVPLLARNPDDATAEV